MLHTHLVWLSLRVIDNLYLSGYNFMSKTLVSLHIGFLLFGSNVPDTAYLKNPTKNEILFFTFWHLRLR